MNVETHIKKTIVTMALFMGVIGCSSKPEIKELPKSADVKQEITKLEVALEESRKEENDLLAPISFKEAKNSLDDARKMDKEDKKKEKILKEVALGEAYLERAEKVAMKNRAKIQNILIARQTAKKANADTLLPHEFAKLDKKLKEEMRKLEKHKEDELSKKGAGLIVGYLNLELAAIKKVHLGESKFLIDEAVRNGASTLTPKSLANANKKYHVADQYITQNRYNTPQIRMISAEVLQEARQLESTVATARGLTARTPEETALAIQSEEEKLHKTREALAASRLEKEKADELNAIYEEARAKFTPEEAEVYKQGPNLVIRLRSIAFPTSKALIKGKDFALLKKVEEVIQTFDKSIVVVEGHTDSLGGKEMNQKLSEERAEAVKQYLEANTPDRVTEFESKGLGDNKPLASNKTAKGRAQNRRVDIIIEPVKI